MILACCQVFLGFFNVSIKENDQLKEKINHLISSLYQRNVLNCSILERYLL